MTRIIVLQHSPYEPLGIMINTLRRMKMRLRYINFHRSPIQRIDLEGYDGLVVLGGNMNPDQLDSYPHLSHEMALIEQAMKNDLPVLGICLGSQLLNMVLGGACYRLKQAEFGWGEINQCAKHDVFTSFGEKPQVFQWHQYASRLSSEVEAIYENARCVQAFSHRVKHIGLQFHIEIDGGLLNRWLEHPDYLTHLRAHIGKEEIESIKEDTRRYLLQSIAIGTQFFEQFCLLFDKKKGALKSMHAGK